MIDIKKNKNYFLLLIFVLLCLFFRIYKFEIFFLFEHDQDLFSWIVKDILVDHHIRLIGQLTSIDGVFIGPLFYYMLVPFFALFKMNPLGALVPILIIAVFSLISIYFVFSKMFNKTVGTIGAFIYAVSVGNAFYDRWIVPTQPTFLWCIWYLFLLLSLVKGNFKVLPILGILMGLVWHVHVALIVLVLPVPLAIFMSKKKLILKDLILPIILFLILTAPFWVFEVRHNYQQVNGFIKSLHEERGELKGIHRLEKEFIVSSRAFSDPILLIPKISPPVGYISFFLIFLFLYTKKILEKQNALILLSWIGFVLMSQLFSKRPLSEYYFSNLNILTILIYTLLLSFLYKINRWKPFIKTLMIIYLIVNLATILLMSNLLNGFAEKIKVVEYIKNDVQVNNYPCIGINYIADYGTGVGFRYLFWLNGVNLVNAAPDVPVYNIVIPYKYADSQQIFGIFGIIKPTMKEFKDKSVCKNSSKQLLPLLGFTN